MPPAPTTRIRMSFPHPRLPVKGMGKNRRCLPASQQPTDGRNPNEVRKDRRFVLLTAPNPERRGLQTVDPPLIQWRSHIMAIQHTDRPGGRYQEGRRRSEGNGERLAQGLGWFSLGLGLAQIAAPGGMARLIGVPDDDENQQMMRAVGMREVASGLGILSNSRPEGWVWARIGGDVMDLSLLGGA